MGMDGIEIVMLTEEKLGIELSDEEVRDLRTPRMLIDLAVQKLRCATAQRCQSQRSFHLLRRSLMRVTGVSRGTVRLQSAIRSFVEKPLEAEFWNKLRGEIDARSWPALGLARNVEWVRDSGLIAVWVGTTAVLAYTTEVGAAILGGVIVVGFCAYGFKKLAAPWEKFVPIRYSTVRDLIPLAATSNRIDWSRDEVADVVRDIVMAVLSPKKESYHEDADFVKDLGLN